MAKSIYGELIHTFNKESGKKPGLLDRTLEIYRLKKGLKGVLWNSGFMHWKSGGAKPLDVVKFRGAEATVDNVRTHFGF